MNKKSKEELSEIAHKAVETRRIKLRSKDMLCAMLTLIQDGNLYHVNDLEIPLSKIFSISNEELAQTLSSGQKRFLHRVGWAKWPPCQAGGKRYGDLFLAHHPRQRGFDRTSAKPARVDGY